MGRIGLVALFLLGCGDDTAPSLDLVGSGGDLGVTACSDPNPVAGSVCPVEVTGTLAPEAGINVDGLVVSVCAGLCFNGSSNASGAFSVVADLHIVLADYALEVHGRPSATSYYAPLPASPGTALAYAAPLPLLHLPDSGPAMPEDGSAQVVTSGDLTLAIPAGTKIQFSVEDFGVPHGHELRVLRVAQPSTLPFVDAASPPAALYAISPFEAGFKQKVPVGLANAAALPANAAVELLVLHGLLNDTPPAGHLVHAANAHVSADGTTISTDAGEGISELTWIGVRAL